MTHQWLQRVCFISLFPYSHTSALIRILHLHRKYDEYEDAHNNDNVGEWDQVDSGNVFKSFEMDDIVSAWFDDGWYTAQIIEVDNANQCFTLRFIDDQQETDNYQGRWMKHIVQDEN